jgi:D-alanyl-D-alanine carboxypeptidase
MLTQLGDCPVRAPRRRSLGPALLGALIAIGAWGSAPAQAHHWHAAAAGSGPVFEWIVLDAETGQVLGEQSADEITYPASLTKMMTLYLAFEQLNLGHITLDRQFTVSAYAAGRAPSRLGLSPGETVSVHDLILGIVTKSANDAATVLAEGLAGGEENFARYMNWKARELGMNHTWYDNPSGLPDPAQRTTARDIARLALALYQHFPREYRYFSTREFEFRGQLVHGHDHLLDWYPGADGIKTGFINASGFNLATSAVRNGRRLIGVVMGGRSARIRDVQMASLLDQGFAILAAGRLVAPQAETLVAAATPAQPPFPAPPAAPSFPPPAATLAAPVASSAVRPAAAPAQPAAAVTATAEARATAPEDRQAASDKRSGLLAALHHLAPVSKAEASPLTHAEGADFAIQIGAFRAAGAAEHAAREAAHLAVARGKPQQVLVPTRSERPALYRARLLHFTQKGAQAACAELRHRGLACSVVHFSGAKIASS